LPEKWNSVDRCLEAIQEKVMALLHIPESMRPFTICERYY